MSDLFSNTNGSTINEITPSANSGRWRIFTSRVSLGVKLPLVVIDHLLAPKGLKVGLENVMIVAVDILAAVAVTAPVLTPTRAAAVPGLSPAP